MSALLNFAHTVTAEGGRVLSHTSPAYAAVMRSHAALANDARTLLGGGRLDGMRLDSIPEGQRKDTNGNTISMAALAQSKATVHAWARAFGDAINWRTDSGNAVRMDALIPVASQALTYFYNEVMEIVHNDLPAYDGAILPIDRKVPTGAETYATYEKDLVGVARAASTYTTSAIPMVGGPAAQVGLTGKIVPFLVGMEVNFRDAIQQALARANGKPDFQLEKGKTDACQRAIMEAINFLWLYGDATMGIDGLMNHPSIGTYGITGAWSAKTAANILDDLTAIVNAIPNRTAGQLRDYGRIKIMLPPDQFQRANSIPVTAAGSETVLSFVLKTYPGLKVEQEFSFAATNSQIYTGGPQGLSRDRGLILYDQKDATRDPSFVLSQAIEMPAPPRQNGLGETMFFHARAGGCKVPDARGILFVEGL